MPEPISIKVNGTAIHVSPGTTVAVAITITGAPCRLSVSGEPRGPLCGMGICYECRVKINNQPHQRGCQILCSPGMEISTNE